MLYLSPEPMELTRTQNPAEVCHRCLEPVPPKAPRCPRCGEPIHKSANIRVILGVFGLVMFLAVALVAFRLMQSSPGHPVVTDDQEQRQAGAPATPPPPEKKPALGQ